MKQTVKKITSLVLVLALSLIFLPLRADASTVSAEKNATAFQTLYRAQGNQISSAVCAELEKRSIPVREDTVVKIVSLGSGKGTAIQVLNKDGNTATISTLTAMDEEGQPKTFTATDMVQTRSAGGGNAHISPFYNTFSITCMVSFNYFSDGTYTNACIQPLTAMYIYYDNNNLYTVKSLRIDYFCTGTPYKKSGNIYVPETTGLNQKTHTITVDQTNPSRSTYYSNNDNPYPTNKALYQIAGVGGVQAIDGMITVVRKSDNKTLTRSIEADLTLNFPN